MSSPQWSAAAWKRFDRLGLNSPVPAKWLAFEKESVARYTEAKAKARKLLDLGKKNEAVKLLNNTAENIWKKAADILL